MSDVIDSNASDDNTSALQKLKIVYQNIPEGAFDENSLVMIFVLSITLILLFHYFVVWDHDMMIAGINLVWIGVYSVISTIICYPTCLMLNSVYHHGFKPTKFQ